ncbi:MAG: transposase [Saprospiraceae bacterium]|nr:transposase [Lewinella sp.]
MRKRYDQIRSEVNLDQLIDLVRGKLLELPDPRSRSVDYTFHDLVMSAFAVYHFKYPSLNRLEEQTTAERENLHQLFKIGKLCSDAHLRSCVDQVDPSDLRELYPSCFQLLKRSGVLREYALADKQLICSVDGVEHFSSQKVHCPHCQERHHRNGQITYSHSMLCAALVHPDQREVFIMGSEPIKKQDGSQKNDCERNAAHRLLDWMSDHYKDYNLLFVEDALYANGPHLRRIRELNWNFIVNIKPGSHELLFKLFDTRKAQGSVRFCQWMDKQGTTHRFWYDNDLPLNEACADVRVNVLMYEEELKNGSIQRFSWATSIPLSRRNVEQIMRQGRSRWKIENETFNTLKNQGYNFEHNFGHGSNHLATFMAYMMLLAFLVDQIFQRCNQLFNRIWKAAKTKVKMWEITRSLFMVRVVYSFKEFYIILAQQFSVQLE